MRGHNEPTEDGSSPSGAPDFGGDFFERLVGAATDAVVTADADGTVVYANDAVESLLGYDPDALCGQRFVDFVPERLRDRYEEWHARYADGDAGTPMDDDTFEVMCLTADGGEKRLSASAFAHESDGRRLFTGILRDAPDLDEQGERLREEEALVEEIFDTSPIALSVRDADGELLRANDRAAELVGVGTDELPMDAEGEHDPDDWTVYDADGDRLSRAEFPTARALATGDPVFNEEVVVERPDDSRMWLSVNAAPVHDGNEVRRVVSAAEDITELKESQHELEQRREELETELAEVFHRITDAFFALNDDWEFTYVNDTAEELLSRTEVELVGKNLWEEFPEAVKTTFQREYERAMETQEPVSFVEYYPPLSTWFEVRAYPSETGLSVYFQDVTERVQRERELERYETIVETVDDGIYVMGEEMELSMVNTGITEMTGYDREELLGTPAWRFFADDVEALRETVEELDRKLLGGEQDAATIELDVRAKDGEAFPIEATWVVQETADGYERIGVVRDITERKERERELQKRVSQQRVLADFSQRALEDRPPDDLFDEAAELVADTLGHDYCKVLELSADRSELLLRNGVGWREGIVGSATVANDRGSQAGYTLLADDPVVVEDLETEERFSGPELLTSHGVQSGISTVIGTPDEPWGILGTHDTPRQSYADHDVQFVQSMANILATAIRRREREDQLERYETIVETVEDGVYALDADERFVMVNDALLDMLGYDREELLGEHASVVHSREINDRVAEMSGRVEEELGSVTVELDLRTKGGETIPVESRFGPYRYEDDRFARTGVVRDVTERKRFEQTLTALHGSSRELLQLDTAEGVAESVLRTATDVLGIPAAGIYLWDETESELRPTAVSEYVADLFDDLPAFGPGDTAITWRAFETGETVTFDDVRETDLTHRENTPLRSGIWIPLGEHGVLAVVSDEVDAFGPNDKELADLLAATAEAALDRVERERERREHERRLEAQNERLDAFASMLAHELRNPLEIAQIYLDMGIEDATAGEAATRSFREVEQALDRIEEMIDTLLVVTRRRGDVDSTEVVDLGEVAPEWWDTLDDRDGRLEVLTDRKIRADPSRLRQLLENLFRNAVEHGSTSDRPSDSEDAEPDVTVRVGDLEGVSASETRVDSADESVGVSAERSEDEAGQGAKRTAGGFYVEDDGPGIDEATREKVFEPGYSTSNVGIGFGLAVVRQLVEAHDWECEITESPEGGARFEFRGVDVVESDE